MWTALITGLAALAGAAVGGLTTVWATHRTNVAAAERERTQRLHDRQAERYNEAKDLITEFLALWWRVHSTGMMPETTETLTREFAALGARIGLLLPELESFVDRAVTNVVEEESDSERYALVYGLFFNAARDELAKLEPTA